MPNFQRLYEWIFKSFRINGNVNMVQLFEQEQVKKLMIIRRSWMYGVFVNLLIFPIIAMMVLNVIFVTRDFVLYPLLGYPIAGLLVFSILLTAFSGGIYLLHFHAIHGKHNNVLDIDEGKNILLEENKVFSEFFNRVTLSYFLYIIVILLDIGYHAFIPENPINTDSYLNMSALLLQVLLIAYYRRRMIDLEMDYILVIPGKIYLIDQIGVHTNTQTLQLMSNIKIIQGGYPSFLGSFFNFGTIEIALDMMMSPTNPSRSLHMHYVMNPIETANKINELLENSETPGGVMGEILQKMGFDGQSLDEREMHKYIGEYLVKHEESMKRLFMEGTSHEKQEIVEIYKKYLPHHTGF